MTNAPVPFTVRANYTRAASLLYRHGFAGDHRFIHGALAFEDHTIDGNFFAGTHAQAVAELHLLERDVALAAIFGKQARHLWTEIEQRTDRAGSLAARAEFQYLPQQHKRHDCRCCFEVNIRAVAHAAERRRKYLRETASPPRCTHTRRPCPWRSA